MHNGTPRYRKPLVNGLSADDTGSSYFIRDFPCLVENEGEDILVVCHSDD